MKRTPKNPGEVYGRQLDRVAHAERRMRRAFNAWDRERRTLASMSKRLDAALSAATDLEASNYE